MTNTMIKAEHISLCYRMSYYRVKSAKEYMAQDETQAICDAYETT